MPTKSRCRTSSDGYLMVAAGKRTQFRAVGYYNATHDLICFVRQGDVLSVRP